MKPATPGAMLNTARSEATLTQLVKADHSVLAGSKVRDRDICTRLAGKTTYVVAFSARLAHAAMVARKV